MLVMQLSWMPRSFCRTRVRAIIDDGRPYYIIYGGHATRRFLISASPTAGAAGGRQETPYKEVIVHCMHRLDMQLAGSKKITVTTGKWPQTIYAMKADYTLKRKQTCGCFYIYPLFPPAHTKPENTCM